MSDRFPRGIPPKICEMFEQIALRFWAKGVKRFSADLVLHLIRIDYFDRGVRGVKINDHWSSTLARWFLGRHRDKHGFFRLRALRRQRAA